jgi:hypothetical protein
MAVDTATVEVLTAQVRILMVESRQVTLSVARQLDMVDLMDLAIFGRVNLGRGVTGTIVIGRATSGELALAKVRTWFPGIDAAYVKRAEAAENSPLIVLAGLK